MRDEYTSEDQHSFYGLTAKIYAVKLDGAESKKTKRVSKDVVRNN